MKSTLNNLLIVEDNPFIGKNIFDATKGVRGIKDIRMTESLQEAISFLNDTTFTLIILDLKLPDGNGIEVLKWLIENKVETKVFVFSMSTALKQICLKHGAFAFYDKATDFDKLIEAVKIA
ncbi:response regulator [Polaribacter sp. ALD11]|uniref:response regulator n=1 Tax=Polaribacter sp. ALD11 TaxID=2058137 RepID=UPI0012FE466C|nr:response regulator [Polaribacter sp. ALD11]